MSTETTSCRNEVFYIFRTGLIILRRVIERETRRQWISKFPRSSIAFLERLFRTLHVNDALRRIGLKLTERGEEGGLKFKI